MRMKKAWSGILGALLISMTALTVSAQVGRLEGDVVKAGTGEIVVGAEIQIVRTDIKGNYKDRKSVV